MTRLAIVVEGETEEEFVKLVLAEYLYSCGVDSRAILSRGAVPVNRLASRMHRLYWSFDYVTSLFDFYRFPGRPSGEHVEDLERQIDEEIDNLFTKDWDRNRVFAYVQKHEFEGLLFSDVGAFMLVPGVSQKTIKSLQNVRACFTTPEDIDDGPKTAPSKRISRLVDGYRKLSHGPLVAEDTGLERIRTECPRFDSWVSRLESLRSP